MRLLRASGVALVVLAALALATFALPVREWRTGELPAPALPLVAGGPSVEMPARFWIDTDAACGHGRTTDPDDCLAILLLAGAVGPRLVGISTVFGNATLDATDSITRDLAARLRPEGTTPLPVHRGSAAPAEPGRGLAPAHLALRRALGDGALTIVSLGPLTNIAVALADRPDLQGRVGRLVAVMGRRPGHLFHPAEGKGRGILFGHGPVFSDFNFEQDRGAAAAVLAMRLPTTLIPYEVGRRVTLARDDLDRLAASGGALVRGSPAAPVAGWTSGRRRSASAASTPSTPSPRRTRSTRGTWTVRGRAPGSGATNGSGAGSAIPTACSWASITSARAGSTPRARSCTARAPIPRSSSG